MAIPKNTCDLEKAKFRESPATPDTVVVATLDENSEGVVKVADSATSEIDTIGTLNELVAGVSDQLGFTITSLGAGRIHYDFDSAATTSNAFIRRGEQLVVDNYSGSLNIIASAGTISYQIDIKTRS